MFDATDSVLNLQTVFSVFTEGFLALQREDYFITLGNTKYSLNVFLFGDYEFLCKTIGHVGASATYPCLWCYVRITDLANNKGVHSPMLWNDSTQSFQQNPSWPAKRTVGDLQTDLIQNKEDPRRGGDPRANSSNHHSIAHDPILPIVTDIDNIIPPSLHILLGLVVRYYKYLETYCRSVDQGSLRERDEELFLEWERASRNTKVVDEEYLQLRQQVCEEEEMLKSFKKALNFRGPHKNVKCSMPLCAISACDAMGNVEWVQCIQCGKDKDSGWYHLSCLRLTEQSVSLFSVCPVCKGDISDEESVITFQKEQVNAKKKKMHSAKAKYEKAKSHLDNIYGKVLETRGPVEKRLNAILENDLKVTKQAYHSQCFVGNHCKIILEQSSKLLEVVHDVTVKQKLTLLFENLREIFSYFDSRFLTEEEVTKLCHLCWKFGSWFPLTFPEERIPPKLHFLIAHIPECALKWRTVGLLGEHGLESIHAALNAEERVYASVREKEQRLHHIFNQHGQRAMADKSRLAVVKRKCSVVGCGGRYRTVSGVRKCQQCGLS